MCRPHGELVRGPNQRVGDSRFRGRMARIGDDFEGGFRPGPMQGPGGFHGCHHIVAALNDHAGNGPELGSVSQQLVVPVKEAPVDEVVAFDAGEGQGKGIPAEFADELGIGAQRKRAGFPLAPGLGAGQLLLRVVAGQPLVIGRNQIAALSGRDGRQIGLPDIGKQHAAPSW